jgi:predicted O-methyltransferase YrrM
VNASTGRTSPKSAPKATSWAYAEDFVEESEATGQARSAGAELDLESISRGASSVLTVLAKAVQAKAVVEIGTGSGASGLALFAGMQPDGILTSVDIEAAHQQAARKAFLSVGIKPQRFRLIAGTALNVLPRLSDGAYDLVFIDGDVLEYADYVEQAVRLLRHGGVLALNNSLGADRVAEPANTDDETESVRAALTAVQENDDLLAALLPVGDGLLVAIKS